MDCFDDVTGKLGFGLMRLPKTEGAIDIDQVIPMVDAFLAAGFNYFDTAWAYVGSEEATRKALVERYPRDPIGNSRTPLNARRQVTSTTI